MSAHSPLRIAVLSGGFSPEREISLAGGRAAITALRQRGHVVQCHDPAEIALTAIPWAELDIAFLVMHGEYGEDGGLQAELDRLGVNYTGSGAVASRLAFSKSAAKQCFDRHGVDTPCWELMHKSASFTQARQICALLEYPVVVKPDRGGSSLGVSIVADESELAKALDNAFAYGDEVVIERAILGTEWTVGLLDQEPLPLMQIEAATDLFTFDAKYRDRSTRHRFDFDVSPLTAERIIKAGVNAAAVIGTQGICRVDIRLDQNDRPWVLEVNTIPGLTETSLVPDAASRVGWSLGELCERAIHQALQQRRAA